jgi:hypothetical protein
MTWPAIRQDLQALLVQHRTPSFKAKHKGDVKLREKAKQPHDIARFESKRFRHDELMKDFEDRQKPVDESKVF